MKKNIILIVFSIIALSLNVYGCSSIHKFTTINKKYNSKSYVKSDPEYTYLKEVHGKNLIVFSLLPNGNIKEYIFVQGIAEDFDDDIINIQYSEIDKYVKFILSNNKFVVYSIDDSDNAVCGIAHGICTNPEGVSRDDAFNVDIAAIGTNGSNNSNCDSGCVAGGCGSNSCSSSIFELSCSVSCNTGYFACCGASLKDAGCFCKSEKCCSNSNSVTPKCNRK